MGEPKIGVVRKYERISVKVPVRIRMANVGAAVFEGEMQNLSEGGAFIFASAPVRSGEEIQLEIRFAEAQTIDSRVVDGGPTIEGENSLNDIYRMGIVRWQSEAGVGGFGVEFIDSSEEQILFIRKIMSYFLQLSKAGVSL